MHIGHTRRSAALGVGVSASVAIHVVILVFVRISMPAIEGSADVHVTFEQPAQIRFVAATPEVPQVVEPVVEAPAESDLVETSLAGAASMSAASAASALPAAAAAPEAGDPILAAAQDTAAPVLAAHVAVVPDPNMVLVSDAPELDLRSEPEAEENVPVWRPGSVGNAKRQWAGEGSGVASAGKGAGIGLVVGRGPHCPMPGRGRPVPPLR